jgi:DNA-binding response OmpR family regulator
MQKRILVIEDNLDIANLVSINLRGRHLFVDHAANGEIGLKRALSGEYHLVILDIMLPGMDGMDVCRALRAEKIFTPVLMLTAKTSELDRVLGLEVGADDYLPKPFSIPELVARVNAILRREHQYRQPEIEMANEALVFDELEIDPSKRRVRRDEHEVELTAKEFDLLWQFARHPGRVHTRAQLLDSVWGYGHDGFEHTVNSHINRLRAKIERDPTDPRVITTVWGVGYKFGYDHVTSDSAK